MVRPQGELAVGERNSMVLHSNNRCVAWCMRQHTEPGPHTHTHTRTCTRMRVRARAHPCAPVPACVGAWAQRACVNSPSSQGQGDVELGVAGPPSTLQLAERVYRQAVERREAWKSRHPLEEHWSKEDWEVFDRLREEVKEGQFAHEHVTQWRSSQTTCSHAHTHAQTRTHACTHARSESLSWQGISEREAYARKNVVCV